MNLKSFIRNLLKVRLLATQLLSYDNSYKHNLYKAISKDARFRAHIQWHDKYVIHNKLIVRNCSLLRGTIAFTKSRATLEIGANTSVGAGTIFMCSKHIKVGNNCLISFNCLIADNDGHSLDYRLRQNDLYNLLSGSPKNWDNISEKSVIIEDNVWIGANCIILRGVSIGTNSIIGAGSVLRSSVPQNSLVYGNPAKVIKRLDF